jgi:dihydrofolate reductase
MSIRLCLIYYLSSKGLQKYYAINTMKITAVCYDRSMRKLIMWNVITLDGYFEGKKAWDLDFHQTVWGKEMEELTLQQLKSADMIIYGTKTYQGMADYWTKETDEKAEYMNKIAKAVCSHSLKTASWNNTTIIKNALTEIPELKNQGDGNLFVFGSGILSESLMKAGLFDEYRLCVAPVFLGKGRLLFKDGLLYQKVKLLEARPLQTGGVILRYGVK